MLPTEQYSLVRVVVQPLILVPPTRAYPVPSDHPPMLLAAAARRGAAWVVAAPLAARYVEEIDSLAVDLRHVAGALLCQLHLAVVNRVELQVRLTVALCVLPYRISDPCHLRRYRCFPLAECIACFKDNGFRR